MHSLAATYHKLYIVRFEYALGTLDQVWIDQRDAAARRHLTAGTQTQTPAFTRRALTLKASDGDILATCIICSTRARGRARTHWYKAGTFNFHITSSTLAQVNWHAARRYTVLSKGEHSYQSRACSMFVRWCSWRLKTRLVQPGGNPSKNMKIWPNSGGQRSWPPGFPTQSGQARRAKPGQWRARPPGPPGKKARAQRALAQRARAASSSSELEQRARAAKRPNCAK